MRPITVLATTTLLALGTMSPAGATYEGQEGRIAFGAFVATDRTQGDIWSVRPDGQALRQLTDAAGLDICPAYSADGKHIAFCSNRTGAYEIWVMDANGKDERQLTALGARSLFPDFSPDGSTVAFAGPVVTGGVTDLWTVPTAGGTPIRVTDTPDVAERLPVWSPDGNTLLYVAGPPTNASAQLWTLDVATGIRTQLTFDDTFKDQTPDWSPDGQLIAYEAGEDVWRMAADGTGQVNLTQTPSIAEFGAAFSPDGTEISFTGTGGPVPPGERYVQVMAADGSDRHVLVPTPGLLQAVPAWQPLGAGR
jgi:Tol biopolymer transport system component